MIILPSIHTNLFEDTYTLICTVLTVQGNQSSTSHTTHTQHTLSLTHTLSHIHTHNTQSQTHTHTLSLSLFLSLTHTLSPQTLSRTLLPTHLVPLIRTYILFVRAGKGHTLTWLNSQGIFPLDAFVRVSLVYVLLFMKQKISNAVFTDTYRDSVKSIYLFFISFYFVLFYFILLHFTLFY